LNDEEKVTDNSKSLIYSIIKDEYESCFAFLDLFKKDYFSTIGAIVAIIAIFGYLVNTPKSIYLIPICILAILLFSIFIIALFFYKYYYLESQKMERTEISEVICMDLFLKNVRPIFFAISVLLFINVIGVIIVLSGATGITNIQEIFFHYLLPNANFNQTLLSLTDSQKVSLESSLKIIEFLYVSYIGLQLLVVWVITYIIYKMRPPYAGSIHILNVIRFISLGIKQRTIYHKQIISSLYYIVLKYADNLLRIFYLAVFAGGCCFIIWTICYTMSQPDLTSSGSILINGILILLIQLVAFIFLLDYFENLQIISYFFDRLTQIKNLKTTLEFEYIHGKSADIDPKVIMVQLNKSNCYSAKKSGFPFLFALPVFSLNMSVIQALEGNDLKQQYDIIDEKLMVLKNKKSLISQWGVVSVCCVVVIVTFSLTNIIGGWAFLLLIGTILSCGLTLRWMKKNLPPAFEVEG
jgi:hypothetical protein